MYRTFSLKVCPHGRYFLVVRAVSRFVFGIFLVSMPNRNQICRPERVSTCPGVQFGRPSILQLNIEGLTAGKMNVLHHLATRLEALVILLQETHCTSAEKLVLSNYKLAESSLSRKHGLATFVHKRLQWSLHDQSPMTSEIEWLCVDVDGYKIVNIYKPPPTQLQVSDFPVFFHPFLSIRR